MACASASHQASPDADQASPDRATTTASCVLFWIPHLFLMAVSADFTVVSATKK